MIELYKRLLLRGRRSILLIATIIIVIFSSWIFKNYLFSSTAIQPSSSSKKIMYWIDPMEPQIHYEGAGKSRMNMDLVPVYEEGITNTTKGQSSSIKISSAVINNLGVRTASVEEGMLSQVIRTFGIIKADEDKISHIHPYVDGFIEKIHTKKSQQLIEKDQPIFDIYSRDLRLAQKEYLLSLNSRNTKIDEEVFLGKLRSLRVPEKQIEQLKKTKKDSVLITIYSPQKGYIDSLNIREGMWVKPETTIMSITDLSEVWVIAEVFPAQSDFVKPDQEVKVFLPQSPNQIWRGKIDYIYPEIDPVSLTTKVRISLKNQDSFFKPNAYVAVEIVLSPKNTLNIPKEAVIWDKGTQHVIVSLGRGRFEPRQVVTGMENDTHIQIISGLNKGEKIVTSAQFLLDSEISLKSALQRLDSSPVSHAERHGS